MSDMLALDAILSTTSIPVTGTSRTLCALIDNKALISCIQKWHHQGQVGTLAPEFDLLQVAQGVMEKYKITVNPEHVKSHQDNTQAYTDQPWQAQLNCDCDQLAGLSWACKQCNDTLHKMYAPPTGHIASLEIAGKFTSSHIASAIKEASYCKELTQYITNQSGWQNTDTFYSIDWEARSRAGKQEPPGQRLTLFKLEFALFATMSRCHKLEWGIDHRCPRCQMFQEHLPMSSNVPVQ